MGALYDLIHPLFHIFANTMRNCESKGEIAVDISIS
ncbi:unnamed protein product [Haemonchus placei]|uniref:Uncharacterized protein n=1 Tax=Haemonchus placei TaxID=6290 RepID=A0A3P7T879_HAEPC|nr:unnamed protein product [Haemonchus placei]